MGNHCDDQMEDSFAQFLLYFTFSKKNSFQCKDDKTGDWATNPSGEVRSEFVLLQDTMTNLSGEEKSEFLRNISTIIHLT